jgi:hypothetical protein
MREFPRFNSDEEFLEYSEKELHIDRRSAERLSVKTRELRWALCYGMVYPDTGDFMGVLSIDSRHDNDDMSSKIQVDTDLIISVAAILAALIRPTPEAHPPR